MSDLISRQAAINAILSIKDHDNSDRANALGLAELAITTLPSAEPKHGHLDIEISSDEHQETYRCSECGHQFNRNIPTEELPKESGVPLAFSNYSTVIYVFSYMLGAGLANKKSGFYCLLEILAITIVMWAARLPWRKDHE